MNRKLTYIALAAAALVACTKNTTSTKDVEDVLINFTPAVGMSMQSKADAVSGPVSGTKLPEGNRFYSIAYYKASSSATDSTRYIPLSVVSYSGDSWTTETKRYWPKSSGSVLDFFSIYPAEVIDEKLFDFTAGVWNGFATTGTYDVNEEQDYDLMIADAALGCNGANSGSGVTTTFHHKLAYIKGIKISTEEDYSSVQTYTLNSITLKGIKYKGTYTYDAWTAEDATVDAALHTEDAEFDQDGLDATITENGYYFLLPQTIPASAYFEIVYTVTQVETGSTDVVTKKLYLNADDSKVLETFVMNKAYTFTIVIGNEVIKWNPSVANWEDETINS